MSRVKVKDPETGQVGYIDDADESVPFEPIEAAPRVDVEIGETEILPRIESMLAANMEPDDYASRPTPDFLNSQAPTPAPARQRHGALEAGALGALRGLTFDFADEIEAAVRAPFSDRTYEDIRDERRDYYHELEEDQPGATMAGQIGGGVLGTLAMPVIRGAGLATRLGVNAVEGAVSAYGANEGEDVGRDVFVGGVLGAGGGMVGEGLQRGAGALAGKLSPALDNAADVWRARTPGGPVNAFAEPGGEAGFGRRLRQEGIGDRLLSGPTEVAEDAQRVIERVRPDFTRVHAEAKAANIRPTLTRTQAQDAAHASGLRGGLPRGRVEQRTNTSYSPARGHDAFGREVPTPNHPVPEPPLPLDAPEALRLGTPGPNPNPVHFGPPDRPVPGAPVRSTSQFSVDMPAELPPVGSDIARSAQEALADLGRGINDDMYAGGSLMPRQATPPSASFRGMHDMRQMIQRRLDTESADLPDREAINSAISGSMDDALGAIPETQAAWRRVNPVHEVGKRSLDAARIGQRKISSRSADSLAQGIGGAALLGAGAGGGMEYAGGDGGRVSQGAGIGAGAGTALGLLGAAALSGRGPRLLESFSRGGALGALGAGGLLDVGGRIAKAYPRTDQARSSLSPTVEAILDDALATDQDPAVTNFLLQSDERYRQAGVEDER